MFLRKIVPRPRGTDATLKTGSARCPAHQSLNARPAYPVEEALTASRHANKYPGFNYPVSCRLVQLRCSWSGVGAGEQQGVARF